MSLHCLKNTMRRIEDAEEHSKIAVFRCNGGLDSFFDTIQTRQRIKVSPLYIGSFCKHDDQRDLRTHLRDILQKDRPSWKAKMADLESKLANA